MLKVSEPLFGPKVCPMDLYLCGMKISALLMICGFSIIPGRLINHPYQNPFILSKSSTHVILTFLMTWGPQIKIKKKVIMDDWWKKTICYQIYNKKTAIKRFW